MARLPDHIYVGGRRRSRWRVPMIVLGCAVALGLAAWLVGSSVL